MGRLLPSMLPILRDGPDGPPQDEGVGVLDLESAAFAPCLTVKSGFVPEH